MKKIKLLIPLILFVVMFNSCSKDDDGVSSEATVVQASAYYPGSAGSTFNYSVSFVDGNGLTKQGYRYVQVAGQTTLGSYTYYLQSNSMIFSDTTSTTSYFRKSDAGVYFLIDTLGLSSYLPSSLSSLLTIEIDSEEKIFNSTLDTENSWDVYGMSVKYSNITFSVLNVTANYLGSEDVTLNLSSGTVTKSAEKVKYTLNLNVPDLTGTGSSLTGQFTAYGWFVKDVGAVKWDGNVTVLNAVSGNSIDFDDTTSTMTQSLTSYSIK